MNDNRFNQRSSRLSETGTPSRCTAFPEQIWIDALLQNLSLGITMLRAPASKSESFHKNKMVTGKMSNSVLPKGGRTSCTTCSRAASAPLPFGPRLGRYMEVSKTRDDYGPNVSRRLRLRLHGDLSARPSHQSASARRTDTQPRSSPCIRFPCLSPPPSPPLPPNKAG
ncbi:hypothetical protein EYF80_001380 [Liparis tanakae]|uniref:Uncharacterized protein n=1 Tax=Liparis tanakae TaxID=230148 RepID=A0A4Z2JF43_9TELE|nr:hypothetical protein EYF80_001380 [Liparis tanakae]